MSGVSEKRMPEQFQESKGMTALEFPHFPTRMQAFIWRNWGLVPVERLAGVLRAEPVDVMELARGMGLPVPPEVDPLWLQRGYITIIRANWHLLPYEQLMDLLEWDAGKLAFTLKEDDFLWSKVGRLKPDTPVLRYRALTSDEKARTARIKERFAACFDTAVHTEREGSPAVEKPFDFLRRFDRQPEADGRQGAVPPSEDRKTAAGHSASSAKGDGFIELSPAWTLVYPDGSKPVQAFVRRFADRLERLWGIRIGTAGERQSSPSQRGFTLNLQISPDASLLAESHELEVAPGRIGIRAVDEPGLLRGLQWLTQEMDRQKGPFLPVGKTIRRTKFDLRYIYSYFAVYGDPLMDEELDPYPDGMLESLSERGVNGIWLHCVLFHMVPWKEAPELSVGWERRIAGLNRLIERAADYGIGVYLYFNEPRAMPPSFYETRPEWKGHSLNVLYPALCTSHPEVQQFLRESTARLFREAPGLTGLFTITMSENVTNCYSRAAGGVTDCPRCSGRRPYEVAAEVNRIISEGARSAKTDARIIAWTWGWSAGLGWKEEDTALAIGQMPDSISLMCTSESGIPTEVAGVPARVADYSMSVVGPGELALNSWNAALERGMSAMAKVQMNNTWECSAVPFLPVFDLVEEHIRNLRHSGVTGLMLSWTLGGYPALNLDIASGYYWDTVSETPAIPVKQDVLGRKFGDRAGAIIAEASSGLSEAFREFPFHLRVLYRAPQNFGPANRLYLEPTGYESTMIGFPYDDLPGWRHSYPAEAFRGQFGKLAAGWQVGLNRLKEAERHISAEGKEEFRDLLNAAQGAYYHFRSTYMQICFVMSRDTWLETDDSDMRETERRNMLAIIDEEIRLARSLYDLAASDSRIGYEASNHYYYTAQDLREKVLNCLDLRERLGRGE
ncbi:MAG: hypothetical protein K0R28_4759 [Paenibacillus sp.]|nr:hypothetical protein [Paenibacillus sp.]